jgi:acyl-CoA dehydrogenase
MAFELDDVYRSLQADAVALARRVEPFAVEADESLTVHEPTLDALRESGLLKLVVPSAFGGMTEHVDPLAICIVREALMAVSTHLDSLFALQGIGSYPISAAGSDAQRADWLPRVATGEILPAFALTEPEAGSDLRSITSTLREDDGALVLDGCKSFISNAGVAAFYVVLAREEAGLSLVLAPTATPGVSVRPGPKLIAPHIIGDVLFEAVALPHDARIGEPGKGIAVALQTLAVFRASVAGAAVGLAQAALDEAVRHTRTRKQFGRPLIELGAVGQLLVDAWADVEMARLLAYRSAERARTDPANALADASLAKLAATEAASRVVDKCVQTMGRFGLVRNSKMERLYRAARPMRIYEGASETLRVGLARDLAARSER